MAELWDRLTKEVEAIYAAQWSTRNSTTVPEPDDLKLGSNDGIKLDAVILYADLAESTNLVDTRSALLPGEIYKSYLHCAGNIVRDTGGTIVSYDGDRVMAVYLGESKNSNAAKAALRINGAVLNIINPGLIKQYGANAYRVKQAVGIDSSEILVARTGVRGDNDLVWVGRAANYAAKLCSYRSHGYPSIITKDVYDKLNEVAKYNADKSRVMWTQLTSTYNGVALYGSKWYTSNF